MTSNFLPGSSKLSQVKLHRLELQITSNIFRKRKYLVVRLQITCHHANLRPLIQIEARRNEITDIPGESKGYLIAPISWYGGSTLADIYGELQGLGVEVYSVSTDTHFSHKAWHETSPAVGKINYFMLGDQNHVISNNFGILREGVGLADRGTFVTDPDGTIQLVEITPEGVGRNATELVRKIKAAKYWREHPGQVCPAKWEEGSDTLAPSLDLVGKI